MGGDFFPFYSELEIEPRASGMLIKHPISTPSASRVCFLLAVTTHTFTLSIWEMKVGGLEIWVTLATWSV